MVGQLQVSERSAEMFSSLSLGTLIMRINHIVYDLAQRAYRIRVAAPGCRGK